MTEQYCLYIKLEPYIKQWLIYECGGTIPVLFPRNSTERGILELFLEELPENTLPDLPKDENDLAILIPCFKHKKPEKYNYLPHTAKIALIKCIKNRFDVQLWLDLHRFGYIGKQQQDLIYAWMQKKGIEPDERNWNSIAKRYQRKRTYYLSNLRAKRAKSEKKSGNSTP